jgi:hypothetical protein
MGVFDGFIRADFTFVFDISVVLVVFINKIINNLFATIRQFNSVLSLDCWTITNFVSGVNIGVTVFINLMDSISELVVFRNWLNVWSWVMRGRVGYNRGSVEGSVVNWSSMMDRVVNRGSVVNRGGVEGSMCYRGSM